MKRNKRPLMGQENEYAFRVLDHDGKPLPGPEFAKRLMSEVRQAVPCVAGLSRIDLYLANGARFYIDHGAHPEYATPECGAGPLEVVRYRAAGEELIADAARRMHERGGQIGEVIASRTNVDYVTGATWAGHENYLTTQRVECNESSLLSHLVTRIIYSGAGGFNNLSAGVNFTLSPRVRHITRVRSSSSTGNRGIVHLKDETLGSEYHRTHVLCGENLMSHVADELRMGTTCLILLLADAGKQPGRSLSLCDPVRAMQAVARDPSCSEALPLASGEAMTALEIQMAYLQRVEEHLGTDLLPEWAEVLCRRWRDVLEALSQAPHELDNVLDWRIKYGLYQQHVEKDPLFTWSTLQAWSDELQHVRSLDAVSGALTAETKRRLLAMLRARCIWRGALERFSELRAELFELDVRYGQVGANGLFRDLEEANLLAHRLVPEDEIVSAVRKAPAGRAGVRGTVISRVALSPTRLSRRYRGHWCEIWDVFRERRLDLSHPYVETEGEWGVKSVSPSKLREAMSVFDVVHGPTDPADSLPF